MKFYQIAIMTSVAIIATGCKVNASTAENTQPPQIIQQPTAMVQNQTTVATPTQTANQTLSNIHQAIQLAEQHTKGTAVELEFHQNHGSAIYDVETIQGTHQHRVQIDAKTGQILSSYSERELDLKPKTKISLGQAINIAQKNISGQVLEASLDHEYIHAHYEVKILASNGHPYEVRINANTGEVVQSKVEYDD